MGKSKKARTLLRLPVMVALALLLALAPVPFSPFAPQDAYAVSDATTIDLTDNNSGANYPGYWTVTGVSNLVYHVHSDVTVIGDTSGSSITLSIDSGVTVTWLANYEASLGGALVNLDGDGTLIIAEGASVINNVSGAAINGQAGGYELIVRGEVGTTTTGSAINASGANAIVSIEGNAKVYASTNVASFGTITMTGTASVVNIKDSATVEAQATGTVAGYGIATNGNVYVYGGELRTQSVWGRAINLVGASGTACVYGGLVEATEIGGIAICTSNDGPPNASVEVHGGIVRARGQLPNLSTTQTGNAIRVNGTNSTVTVTGGSVYIDAPTKGNATDDNNVANSAIFLQTSGTTQTVTISGGEVKALNAGSAISTQSTTDTITISGGQVSAKDGGAVRSAVATTVVVNGGFVFSYGTGIWGNAATNTIFVPGTGAVSIIDDGIVAVWDPPTGIPPVGIEDYLGNTTDNLTYRTATGNNTGARVIWDTNVSDWTAAQPDSGIYYERGDNSGFFEMNDEVFVLSCKLKIRPVSMDFGELPRPYTQPDTQLVTITNIGTGSVSLDSLDKPANYTVSDLTKAVLTGFKDSDTVTVCPNAGLEPNTYEGKITVSGSNPDGIQVLGTPSADTEVTFTVLPSEDCLITEFTLLGQIGATTIVESTDPNEPSTITVVVSADADLESLEIASILPSDFAYIDPDHQAGQTHDFSTPVTYVVTAEDGTTTRTYLVTVIQEEPVATYALTVSANSGGSVTGTPSGIYAVESLVQITAVPSSGYRFTGWTVDGITLSASDAASLTIAFYMPANEVTITANFALDEQPGDDPDDPGDDPDDPDDESDDPDDADEIRVPETGDVKGPWGYSVALLFLLGFAFISLSVEMRERTARRPRHLA
ncbi:MAG: hypothetical protein LBB42_05215 [Coriobacteriales bacterium]|nr:hypothetical protein [Coriobacteriales bacterium]